MTGTVHLAAWNLNHRTSKKAIPPGVIHAIAALDIDVLVLTEFVDGDHQVHFKDSLKDNGFRLPEPKGDWSYHSGNDHGGSRIDHALASPTVAMNEARYIYKAGRHLLAGQANGTTPLSDHALRSIRIARPHEPAHPHASLRLT